MESPSQPRPALPATAPLADRLLTPEFARLLWVQLTFGLSFSAYFLIPKYLTTELRANPSVVGMAAAIPLLTGVVASPLMGRALDRFGRRSLLLLGAWIGVLTSLGMTLVRDVGPFFFAVRALQGLGFALVFNAGAALTADTAPASRLGYAMGLLGSASLVSNAIGPTLAEYTAHVRGWRLVFFEAALMSLLTAWQATRIGEARRAAPPTVAPKARSDVRLGTVAMLMGAAFGALMTFTQPLALAQGAQRVAGFFFGYTIAALLVRIALGSAVDRIGRLRVSRFALILYGVVTMAAALLRPGLLEVLGFAFGVAHGLLYPALAAMVAEKSPPEARGRALTNFNAAFNGGCALSLLGGGVLVESAGYPVVFAGLGAVVVVSVLALTERATA